MIVREVDVLVVGGGPAGLAAAEALRGQGVDHVLVIDREPEAGGVPRHCEHTGFGVRDLRRVLTGPSYARLRTKRALRAGVEVETETTAIEWLGERALRTVSPRGHEEVRAAAVLIATGCRERPRTARLVAGARVAGVLTTGSLQQLVYLRGARAGQRAVVVGAEHVSYSAVHTLVTSGTDVVRMVTEHAEHQSFALFAWGTEALYGVGLQRRTRLVSIEGTARVHAVVLESLDDGRRETVPCDTVVFTGDWIPDHELARAGDIEMDPATRGPLVDTSMRTSRRGVFAAGNVVRGAEIADVAALEGIGAGAAISRFLESGTWSEPRARLRVEAPLAWVTPTVIDEHAPPRDCFVVRADERREGASLVVRQHDRELWRRRMRRVVPNLPFSIPASWVPSASPREDIWLRLE